jgi:hypothetical protein
MDCCQPRKPLLSLLMLCCLLIPLATSVPMSSKLFSLGFIFFLGFYSSLRRLLLIREFLPSCLFIHIIAGSIVWGTLWVNLLPRYSTFSSLGFIYGAALPRAQFGRSCGGLSFEAISNGLLIKKFIGHDAAGDGADGHTGEWLPPLHANGDYPKHPPLATRVPVSSKLYSVWALYFLGFYISMYWLLLIREFLRS